MLNYKHWLTERDKNSPETSSGQAFTNVQARQALRIKSSNQKRYMTALQEWGLIQKTKGDKKNGFTYQITTYEDQQQRNKRITTMLDEILVQLTARSSSSPKEVQTKKRTT